MDGLSEENRVGGQNGRPINLGVFKISETLALLSYWLFAAHRSSR